MQCIIKIFVAQGKESHIVRGSFFGTFKIKDGVHAL